MQRWTRFKKQYEDLHVIKETRNPNPTLYTKQDLSLLVEALNNPHL